MKGEHKMKTNFVKKLTAFTLSALLTAAASVPCFLTASAAEIGTGKTSASDTTLMIPKSVTVTNSTEGDYYGPAVIYSYTIAPTEPTNGAKVKDDNGNDFPVEKGVEGGAVLAENGQVVFGSELVSNVNTSGVEQKKNLTVNIDLAKFTKPGIYRYKIEDVTAIETLYNAGINRADNYDNDRYLDVYIKNNGENGLAVAGYTLTTENEVEISAEDKDSGFVSKKVTVEGQEVTLPDDTYRTYNIRLEKQVTGDMGDKTHEFPFTAVIDNGGLKYFHGKVSNSVNTESSEASLNTTLKNGEVLYIRGLSPRAKIGYTEKNDTADTYKVTIEGRKGTTGNCDTLVAEQNVAADGTAALSSGSITDYETANSAATVATEGELTNYRDVEYTNNLATVSPTGIVLRFAPFIIIAGLGIVLFVLARRTRRKTDSDII